MSKQISIEFRSSVSTGFHGACQPGKPGEALLTGAPSALGGLWNWAPNSLLLTSSESPSRSRNYSGPQFFHLQTGSNEQIVLSLVAKIKLGKVSNRLCVSVHTHTRLCNLDGQRSQEGGGISPESFTENIPNVLTFDWHFLSVPGA